MTTSIAAQLLRWRTRSRERPLGIVGDGDEGGGEHAHGVDAGLPHAAVRIPEAPQDAGHDLGEVRQEMAAVQERERAEHLHALLLGGALLRGVGVADAGEAEGDAVGGEHLRDAVEVLHGEMVRVAVGELVEGGEDAVLELHEQEMRRSSASAASVSSVSSSVSSLPISSVAVAAEAPGVLQGSRLRRHGELWRRRLLPASRFPRRRAAMAMAMAVEMEMEMETVPRTVSSARMNACMHACARACA
jgi:hypothetical protein